jgi:DNA-binding response OmpR family regulator
MKSVTTILFVENDAVALTMYQKRLQREGFHVETAEDGIAALKVLSEMTPDLVVLDLMLPKFSGRDVFDYMRADAQFKNVPVIIFSNASRVDWPKDVESSPTRTLPKSEANFAALLELVRDMIAASAAAAEKSAPVEPAGNPEPQASPDFPLEPITELPPVGDEMAELQTAEQFLEYAIADMPVLREHCLAFIKGPSTEGGRTNLSALRKRLAVLNAGAEKTGCARLSLLAGAWESLLAEIERKPALISPSILQTLAQAADCLRILLNNNAVSPMEPLPQARVLSVDDDEICNDVAVSALQRANMLADSSLDANVALEMLEKCDYNLVLLDINMPSMTGFELCEKLRNLPQHEKTPVIFVTAYNNFENRKQSVLSGGGDLIAKPVSPLELALKVTIHLLKAPPKPVVVPTENDGTEPALVWKEPAQTISHDTEMFLKGVKTLNAAPSLMASTTETSTTDPEAAELAAPARPAKAPETSPVPEEIFAPAAALVPAGPLAELRMKTVEANVLESVAKSRSSSNEAAIVPSLKAAEPVAPMPSSPRIPEPVAKASPIAPQVPPMPASVPAQPSVRAANDSSVSAKQATADLVADAFAAIPAMPARVSEPMAPVAIEKKNLESAPASQPLADKETVVHTQPPRSSEKVLPATNGNSKAKEQMKQENNPQFDTLVLDVAHIIFGDNAPDINVRLVRMALETVWQNRAELQSVDAIAKEIARIIFGETNTSDLNVRLVRMALERSNSIALFKAA